MASVFKPKGKRKYVIIYTDEHGKRRKKVGTTDRGVTERLAREIENRVALRREGLIDPTAESYRDHEARSIRKHLDDFIAHLEHQQRDPRYVHQVRVNALRLVDRAGIKRLSELTTNRVEPVLSALREEGLSLQTLNHSLRHIKTFSRWLAANDRIRKDGLARMRGFNVKTDRRHDRRALSADELARLIQAAERGPAVMGMTGPERALLYRVAAGTGFRANELRSLTAESFDLNAELPTITVRAGYSKRRRDDVQPIRADLADALRPYLAARPAGRSVFQVPDKPAKMLRADLEAAGIPYRDGAGRVADFHALRHSFITALAMSSAPVKVVQTLARHSDPKLTLGVYTHVGVHDQSAALHALPDLTRPPTHSEPQTLAATGTDGPTATRGATRSPTDRRKSLHPRGLEPLTLSSEDYGTPESTHRDSYRQVATTTDRIRAFCPLNPPHDDPASRQTETGSDRKRLGRATQSATRSPNEFGDNNPPPGIVPPGVPADPATLADALRRLLPALTEQAAGSLSAIALRWATLPASVRAEIARLVRGNPQSEGGSELARISFQCPFFHNCNLDKDNGRSGE